MTDWATRLAEAAGDVGVPGAVLGVYADSRETLNASGVLSTRTEVGTTTDSVFQIGSITKTWTATMVAQLAAEGRLQYDATVGEVLPGVRLGVDDVSGRVTVRQLLTHTSGIEGDVFVDTGRGDDCVERYVELLAGTEQVHEPGAAYSYCNSGFVLLGRMIEVLDDRVWDASLRARLTDPLGLDDVCTLPEEAILRRAAVGHHEHPQTHRPFDTWMLPRGLGPAGIITTTAHDLLRYARLHLEGGPPLDEMREPQAVVPWGTLFGAIGLGWRVGDWNGTQVLGHDGGTLGQTAMLRLVPEHGFACCLLTNSAEGGALEQPVLSELIAEHTGLAMPPDPEPSQDAHPVGLSRHAGRYERRAVHFEVSEAGDRLSLRVIPAGDLDELIGDTQVIELVPADSSGDRFVGRSDPTLPWWPVEFGRLDDGTGYLSSSGRIAPRLPDPAPR